jgi:hypothetical protein
MRDVLGFFVGLYFLLVAIVFGGGVYGFVSGETAKNTPCPLPENWLGWSAYRAVLWPKTFFDDIKKVDKLADWYFVRYTPDPVTCTRDIAPVGAPAPAAPPADADQ